MSFLTPWMLAVAVAVAGAGVAGYLMLDQRRTHALAQAGLAPVAVNRRHLPYLLLGGGVLVLLLALARPYGTVGVPRVSSTVVLAVDVSSSMLADDVAEDRLAAARAAARELMDAQPDSVDIGVVSFGEGALPVLQPTADRTEAGEALDRLRAGGGTSLGEAVLASLSMITGQAVALPEEGEPAPDLGLWESATIVVISDGEQTAGADPLAAADLAAAAGVRVEAIGVGTLGGAVIELDGYRIATRLEEAMLTDLAESTGGDYHRADEDGVGDAVASVSARFRLVDERLELTAAVAGLGLLLVTAGGLVMILRTGRLL